MKNWVRVFAANCAGLAVIIAIGGNASAQPARVASKLDDRLVQILAGVGENELVTVSIVMKEQTPQAQIQQAKTLQDRAARRTAVISALKTTAQQSQAGLIDYLNAQQQAGKVGNHIRSLWIHNVVGVKATKDVIMNIAARGDVLRVNDNATIGAEVFPAAPAQFNARSGSPLGGGGNIECGVNLMGAPQVWNQLGITGQGVVVAIVDTGICTTHPDLVNQVWVNTDEIANNNIDDDNNGYVDDVNGWNFENNNKNVTDFNGHGTHVSGTVGGDGTNGQTTGMAPDVQVMMCKFWNSFSGEQSVWDGMQYAVDNDADVISASLGWPHSFSPDRQTWRNVCENAIAAGVVVIYAAGNEGSGNAPDNVRTPGDVPDVLTIGATNCNDGLAGFSSQGPITWENVAPWFDHPYPPGLIKPDVAAPGVDTLSTSSNCSGYLTLSGTSMATPHVAGCVALILQANPNLDHFGVKQILENTALDLGANGKDNQYGAGRVDAFAAVQEALDSAGPTVVTATDVTAFRGLHFSGTIADTEDSDDSYLKYRPGLTLSAVEPPVWLIFVAELPDATPGSLLVRLEASANTSGLTQTIEMYNWNTSAFEQVNSQAATTSDSVVEVDLTGSVASFVDPTTGSVLTRTGWKQSGPILLFPWTVCIDQMVWEIE